MSVRAKPVILCILDGLGLRHNPTGNAVAHANAPFLKNLLQHYPNAQLYTHGEHVGLPKNQMGNSEIGHLILGAGRNLPTMLERVQADLTTNTLSQKPEWQTFTARLKNARAVHMVGLVSDGGVHSHSAHALGLAELLSHTNKPIFVHAITDGRDTPPTAAAEQLPDFARQLAAFENVYLADICGRYYAMDRDKNWARTETAYRLYTEAQGRFHADITHALTDAYATDGGDEFITPRLLNIPAGLDPRVQENDAVLFFNFRADRMRQLVRCFINDPTLGFKTGHVHRLAGIATLTEYDKAFATDATVLYPPTYVPDTFGEVISRAGLTQLRAAESEKYAHVTYFFSGGREAEFSGEQRLLIPSPKVKTYDLQPHMSLPELTEKLAHILSNHAPDVIILNIANGDMVGHTGVLAAGIKAVEAIDTALATLVPLVEKMGGVMLITADHGNCEEMHESAYNTSHTLNPVPVVLVGKPAAKLKNGTLRDVAPTLLTLLNLPIPTAMEGSCLLA